MSQEREHSVEYLTLAMVLSGGLILAACGKDDNPASTEIIPETNLFPFAPGRLAVYTEYSLDTTSSQKIASTVHRQVLYVHAAVTFAGKSAFRLIDSTYTPSGTIEDIDTTYVAVEGGDLLIYQGTSWLTVFKRSEGLNKEYEAGKTVEDTPLGPITVTVKAKIFPKETVSAPIGNTQAYKLEVKQGFGLGTISLETLQYLYVADGFGPVKFQTPVQRNPLSGVKETGLESLMVSKNF